MRATVGGGCSSAVASACAKSAVVTRVIEAISVAIVRMPVCNARSPRLDSA